MGDLFWQVPLMLILVILSVGLSAVLIAWIIDKVFPR